jgi:hypothetical protein
MDGKVLHRIKSHGREEDDLLLSIQSKIGNTICPLVTLQLGQ